MTARAGKRLIPNNSSHKPAAYFAKFLKTPENEFDFRDIPATTAADWDNAEVLLPVTEREFRGIRNFIEKHRKKAANPSSNYQLFAQAMAERKQIVCTYDGHPRELCPIILGHSRAQEKALTFQFGGQSSKGLPPGGQWRCLFLAKVRDVQLRDGPWHAGDSHTQPQGCVEIVDLDVNPASPYKSRRRLRS